jgi:RimJ/RimL family protein N-acetyltransferase
MTSSVPSSRVPDTCTDRLRLREFEPKDAADIFKLISDPKMAEYQSWDPLENKGQAERWVERAIKGQSETPRTTFALVVILKESELFVGNIGADVDIKNSTTELWYTIATQFQGRGYATEAVRALLPLLPGKNYFLIETDPKNTPSRKLAERLGFQQILDQEQATETSEGQRGGMVRYVKEQQEK